MNTQHKDKRRQKTKENTTQHNATQQKGKIRQKKTKEKTQHHNTTHNTKTKDDKDPPCLSKTKTATENKRQYKD